MNIADGLVLLVLVLSGWIAYRRGFILSLFKTASFMISLFLAYKLYPVVSVFLRNSTSLFETLKNQISLSLFAQKGVQPNTLTGQNDLINSLEIPKFLKSALIENNNPEVYKILNVDGIKDYISGYIANICINIIAMIIVLLVVTIGLRIIVGILDIISKLPVLNSINRMFGLFFGLITGVLKVWIFYIIIFIFHSNPAFKIIFTLIENSVIAKFLYEYNLLIKWVLGLFL